MSVTSFEVLVSKRQDVPCAHNAIVSPEDEGFDEEVDDGRDGCQGWSMSEVRDSSVVLGKLTSKEERQSRQCAVLALEPLQ